MKIKQAETLWEDEHLVVMDKPAGLLSVPDRFDPNIRNLKHILRKRYGEIWPIHRLDKDTSGIIVFAKTAETHRLLNRQFADRQPDKQYHCIVEGVLARQEGEITYAMAEDGRKPGRMLVSNKGLSALTRYEVQEQFQHFALIRVAIETGRTHQIRVHMKALGHPVLADPFYGLRDAFLVSSIKGKRYHLAKGTKERPLLSRTALHASQLRFQHPLKEETVDVSTEPPKDMRAVLQQLRKWDKA